MNKLVTPVSFKQFSELESGHSTRYTSLDDIRQEHIVFADQIHGTDIGWIDESNKDAIIIADGLLTKTAGVAVGVRTADCVPMLLYEPNAGIAGAIHAGWRGTLGRIAERAISLIIIAGGRIDHIRVAIGPSIGSCCYDVAEDRASQFIEAFGEDEKLIIRMNGKRYLDLPYANASQCIGRGIPREHIEFSDYCTSCHRDSFFSYRRDRALRKESQMVSFIRIN